MTRGKAIVDLRDRRDPGDELGAALVIATLVTLILTVLGLAFVMMAQTENRIAENEKTSAQALHFAEAGMRVAQRWFDRPRSVSAEMFAWNLDFPAAAQIRRDLRRVDPDGDGPAAPVLTDGNAAGPQPHYKQGVDRNGDGIEDLFDRPYRDDPRDSFAGTAAGPDIRISRTGSDAAKAFLDALSEKLGSRLGSGVGVAVRLESIDVYGPPYLQIAGAWTRYGIATVAVTARVVKAIGATEEILAQRTVRAVVSEIPYRRPFGPLHSCNALSFDVGLRAHWGPATASGPVASSLPNDPAALPASIPREMPSDPIMDAYWGQSSGAPFDAMRATLETGVTIDDPWFRVLVASDIAGFSGTTQQLFPHDGSGLPDHSNVFRLMHPLACPDFSYSTWKAIAQSGGSDVHYFRWIAGDHFAENGSGPPASFATITSGVTGLYFFDTKTRTEPQDADADGAPDNLTPTIHVDADSWGGMRGLLYLNAEALSIEGSGDGGMDATFTLPGEPYRDVNGNARYDPGEPFVNLNYNGLAGIGSAIRGSANDRFPASDASGTPPSYNPSGPRLTAKASFWGILHNTGSFRFDGRPRLIGSLVAKSGSSEPWGSADIYFDPALLFDWPPGDWPLPRVVISRWETDP